MTFDRGRGRDATSIVVAVTITADDEGPVAVIFPVDRKISLSRSRRPSPIRTSSSWAIDGAAMQTVARAVSVTAPLPARARRVRHQGPHGAPASYGYAAIFTVVMLESAGVPLPGETILVSAAVYAGHEHSLDIRYVIAAAAGGAILGDNIGFWVGREFGGSLLSRWGYLVGLDERRRKLGQYLFARHGGKIVFFGRFLALLRAFAALLAGANGLSPLRFSAGGIVWATRSWVFR